MTLLRAVLFDMDGVLVDTAAGIAQLWRDVCDRHGRPMTEQDLRTSVLGCSAEYTVSRLFPELDTLARAHLLDAVRKADQNLPFVEVPGARDVLRALHAHGLPMALVTGASRQRATAVIEACGLVGCFATVVAWGDVRQGKPHPACYTLAAQRLGHSPESSVVFEDTSLGVTAAVNASAVCVGVGPNADDLIAHGVTATVSSLAAVEISPSAENGAIDVRLGSKTLRLHLPASRTMAAPAREVS
jgi:sugar-phosphatase